MRSRCSAGSLFPSSLRCRRPALRMVYVSGLAETSHQGKSGLVAKLKISQSYHWHFPYAPHCRQIADNTTQTLEGKAETRVSLSI